MVVAVFPVACLLSLCFSQVKSDTSKENGSARSRLKEFLAVAEAVVAVERAGGPRKILEDNKYKGLFQPLILDTLQGLAKIEEEQQNSKKEKIQPRFFENLVLFGIKAILNFYRTYTELEEDTSIDPDL